MGFHPDSKTTAVEKKLNIVFLGESYLGGMAGSRRIQNLINPLLSDPDITVSNLIVAEPDEKKTTQVAGTKNKVAYHIIYYRLKNPFSFLDFYFGGIKFLFHARDPKAVNILYCYDNPSLFNFLFFKSARFAGYKIVFDIVENYELVPRGNLSRQKKLSIKSQAFLLNRIFHFADAAFAISRSLESTLKLLVNGRIPVYYLPITVDFEVFSDPASLNEKSAVRIFYGGSFGEKDGLDFLLDAFEIVATEEPSAELILTGKPPRAGMGKVLEHMDASPFKSRIKFLGYLPDQEYFKVLKQSDIFVMSRTNSDYAQAGFPFKLGEMLASGKPVVASRVGDVPLFLTDKFDALLVQPESAKEIAEAIIYLINHPDAAKQIGMKGRETAVQNFDAARITKELKLILLGLSIN
jgi:glycosyltransferase involved in cell wall biosynthesis